MVLYNDLVFGVFLHRAGLLVVQIGTYEFIRFLIFWKSFSRKNIYPYRIDKKRYGSVPFRIALGLRFYASRVRDKVIVYPQGFRNVADYGNVVDIFGKENIFEITQQEMYTMNSNIFSISPDVSSFRSKIFTAIVIWKKRGVLR